MTISDIFHILLLFKVVLVQLIADKSRRTMGIYIQDSGLFHGPTKEIFVRIRLLVVITRQWTEMSLKLWQPSSYGMKRRIKGYRCGYCVRVLYKDPNSASRIHPKKYICSLIEWYQEPPIILDCTLKRSSVLKTLIVSSNEVRIINFSIYSPPFSFDIPVGEKNALLTDSVQVNEYNDFTLLFDPFDIIRRSHTFIVRSNEAVTRRLWLGA